GAIVEILRARLVGEVRPREARRRVQAAIDTLATLAAEQPTNRRIHRWWSEAHLLAARLAERPEAAEDQVREALEVIAPFAEASRDGRVVAPYEVALRCLGRTVEAEEAREKLRRTGYFSPLDAHCPSSGR
ncbi:MAG: hypothetical protein AAGM22_04250, partial [Acidobacteriota bacterium]